MKKYSVVFTETVAYTMEIEAANPEEAAAKGKQMVEDDTFDITYPERQSGEIAVWDGEGSCVGQAEVC